METAQGKKLGTFCTPGSQKIYKSFSLLEVSFILGSNNNKIETCRMDCAIKGNAAEAKLATGAKRNRRGSNGSHHPMEETEVLEPTVLVTACCWMREAKAPPSHPAPWHTSSACPAPLPCQGAGPHMSVHPTKCLGTACHETGPELTIPDVREEPAKACELYSWSSQYFTSLLIPWNSVWKLFPQGSLLKAPDSFLSLNNYLLDE